MKSMCQDVRRNSPSVADCSPTVLLHAHDVADRLVLDRAQLGGVDLARPRARRAPASSSGGRSRLPTWSARNGGFVRDIGSKAMGSSTVVW